MPNNKKDNELYTLKCFKEVYDNKIQILSYHEAKAIFGNYNGENPDFVVKLNDKYFGIELVKLTKEFSHGVYEATRKQNFPHLLYNKKDFETSGLLEVDDLADILNEVIGKKLSKQKNYVTPFIWLLVYADEYYNLASLHAASSDGVLDQIKSYILNTLDIPESIEKIFVFDRIHDFIFEIK